MEHHEEPSFRRELPTVLTSAFRSQLFSGGGVAQLHLPGFRGTNVLTSKTFKTSTVSPLVQFRDLEAFWLEFRPITSIHANEWYILYNDILFG